ncbi:ATP-binding cassette domain-containing protein [Bacillus xiapuensis]|uniref:ATP-binding cassette domain-containing protein n=1 Tax=Bacillus xiapuensis TaxID=2014075 RepID=UPI000C232D5A|nr:ABC transporter ATP-binding protein [Bacillus xiapuensis]
MTNLITAQEASVTRGKKTVLTNIHARIEKGMAAAVVGENGSGKSSMIKLLSGAYEPQTGKVTRLFASYAYVPEHFPEHLPFTVAQYFQLMADMGGSPHSAAIDHYVALFGLEPFLQTPLKKCSKGTKQKAGLIQALLKDADVLFLDEPFTGLDEITCNKAMEILLALRGEKTLIFTLHDEELVQKLATHIMKMKNGRLHGFAAAHSARRYVKICCEMKQAVSQAIKKKAHLLRKTPGPKIELFADEADSDMILADLIKSGGHITEVKIGEEL